MGNGLFKELQEYCNGALNILVEMKTNINDKSELNRLTNNMSRQLIRIHEKIDKLIKENYNNETNKKLREIKQCLTNDEFTDIDESLDKPTLKSYISKAMQDMREICDDVDNLLEDNSITKKIRSFFSNFGKIVGKTLSIASHAAVKAIKYL